MLKMKMDGSAGPIFWFLVAGGACIFVFLGFEFVMRVFYNYIEWMCLGFGIPAAWIAIVFEQFTIIKWGTILGIIIVYATMVLRKTTLSDRF